MARIRTIKPEFFTSEDIVSLTPLARVFYIALWCEADRAGRLDWKTGTLKMRYLPGDDCNFAALAEELTDAGLIVLYEHEGRRYAEIPTFSRHQVINNREAESTRPARNFDASPRVKAEGRKGKEGKERNGAGCVGEELFNKFWQAYPSKVGKDAARKAFEKRKVDTDLLASMIQAIEKQSQSAGWLKDGGQFIPHPATWLNAGRWMDEGTGALSGSSDIFAGVI